jgi:hypothetical protein
MLENLAVAYPKLTVIIDEANKPFSETSDVGRKASTDALALFTRMTKQKRLVSERKHLY